MSILAASEKGDYADIVTAIDRGANIEIRGRFGSTPLMFAAQFGHTDCVALLLDRGAIIGAEKNGVTALICASVEGHEDCISLLLDRGADIKAADEVSDDGLQQTS